MQPLLDALVAYVPSPAERPLQGEARRERRGRRGAGDRQRPGRRVRLEDRRRSVRRTHHDVPRGLGTLKADSTVHNVTKDTPERLGHLVLLQGKTQTTVPEIKAGDIGAVAKLKETQTSDMIADKAVAVHARRAIKFPEPVISYAIEPKSRGDEEKISTALHRLQEEDPDDQLHARRADEGAAARRPGTARTSR